MLTRHQTITAAVMTAATATLIVGANIPAAADERPHLGTVAPATMPTIPAAVHDVTRTPILLVDIHLVDPRWGIASAVQDWNDATGCELFILVPDRDWHETWRVVEVPGLTDEDGVRRAGLTDYDQQTISLDPAQVHIPGVAAHEEGHVAGHYDHHDSRYGVMSGLFDADRSGISHREAQTVRQLQERRCGS